MKITKVVYNAPKLKHAVVETTCEFCGAKKYEAFDTNIKYVRDLGDRVARKICEKCGRTSK